MRSRDPLLESKASKDKYWYGISHGSQEPTIRKRLQNDIRPCAYMPRDEEYDAIVQHELFKRRLKADEKYIDKHGPEQFEKSWTKIRDASAPLKPSSNPFIEDERFTKADREHPSFELRYQQEKSYIHKHSRKTLVDQHDDILSLKAPVCPFKYTDEIREHPTFRRLLYENFGQAFWYYAKCKITLKYDPTSRYECYHDKESCCEFLGSESQVKKLSHKA